MGVLSKLVDPTAPRHTDPEREPSVLSTEQSLAPPASVMASMTQTAEEPEIERAEARTALEGEAPLPASTAEAAAVAADLAASEKVVETPPEAPATAGALVVADLPVKPTVDRLKQALSQLGPWRTEGLDDQERVAATAQLFTLRRLLVAGCAEGDEEAMADTWARYAPEGAPSFDDMLQRHRVTVDQWPGVRPPAPAADFRAGVDADPSTGMARVPPVPFAPRPTAVFPHRPTAGVNPPPLNKTPSPAAPKTPGQSPSGGGGGGFGLGGLVKAPFLLAGAAGSLVLAGLQQAGGVAHNAYVRSRVNGHSVLAAQLDQSSQRVVSLADQLKHQGMGDVVDAIRRTGAPPEDVFKGMQAGGKYDNLGKQYDRLMRQPAVAQTFADLQAEIDHFGHLSQRYAKTGAALNLDVEAPIQRGSDAMMGALEGMPVKEGGAFKHLQDRLRDLTQQIVEMVQRLFSRLTPA